MHSSRSLVFDLCYAKTVMQKHGGKGSFSSMKQLENASQVTEEVEFVVEKQIEHRREEKHSRQKNSSVPLSSWEHLFISFHINVLHDSGTENA